MDGLLVACAFTFAVSAGGQSVTAHCPMPVYRVIAQCGDPRWPQGGWTVRGPLADARGSTAMCAKSRIIDYRVETA
ncbi:hypothetical protein [Kutzneria sp. NPDC052558]|uniref:hypothetical protein n=1 Tax=Kutzneria sp. NPDC052558 TaxID=3364121 RepID=UPI0037CA2FF3